MTIRTRPAMRRSVVVVFIALVMAAFQAMFAPTATAAGVTITVAGDQRFQTIDGFGVNINAHSWDNGELKPALDILIDENGSTIFRVVMEMADWEQTNDNADPQSYNWAYYDPIYSRGDFDEAWSTIEYLRQKGIPSGNIILSFMGIGPTWMGGASISSAQEDEWVEQVTSAAYYGHAVRGADFGVFSPNNEEDWGHNEGITMSAAQYARVMNKVARRLDGLGLTSIRLAGPETASACRGAGEYWSEMTSYATLMSRVDHLSLHDYSGATCDASARIEASAYPKKSLWVTEFSVYDQAQSFLEEDATALLVWDGYDSVYQHAILNDLGDHPGNDAGNAPALLSYDAGTKTYAPRKEFYQYSQLFRYVPRGAVRLGASSSDGAVHSLAFHDAATGRLTVVGNNTADSPQTLTIALTNLGAYPSTLKYFQTNSSSNMLQGPEVAVSGGFAKVTVPAATVFTLTGIAGSSVDTTPPAASITSPLADATVSGTLLVSATTTDQSGVSAVQFQVDGENLGDPDSTAPFSVSWDTSSTNNGRHAITATATDAAGNLATSSSVVVTVSNSSSASAVFLLGNQAVESYADRNDAGTAESFRFVADGSGHATAISIYIGDGSTASSLAAGIYSDNNRHPDTLLAGGLLSEPAVAEWNTVFLNSSASLTKGTAYWIGVLSLGGTVHYRDQGNGECSESATNGGLTALPTTWRSGLAWPTCNLSAYVAGVASTSDTSPPSVPPDLTLTGTTQTSLEATWGASADNVGVTWYEYYIDDKPLERTTGRSAEFSNLACQTSHEVGVYAYDAAGNRSLKSVQVATTSPCSDTEPPSASITSPLADSTIAGTLFISATATDESGVSAVQFQLDGENLGDPDSTAPFSVSWDTSSTNNGKHAISATATDGAGNMATSKSIYVTVSNNTVGQVMLDKVVTKHQSSTSTSISSPPLTTARSNELLVAFMASDGPSDGAQRFVGVIGGGLVWTLRSRVNAQSGTSEIWTAVAPEASSNVAVTANRENGSYAGSITLAAFTNTDTSRVGAVAGSSGGTGAPATRLTATQTGSVVWGVGNDWDRAVARTVGPRQSTVDEYKASVGDTYWVQRLDDATIAGQEVTISDSAPTDDQWNLAAIELLPEV